MKQCPQCGRELPPDAPEGNCPACLVGLGLSIDVAETPTPDGFDGTAAPNEPAAQGDEAKPRQDPGFVLPTERIGPYIILNKLGQGGSGDVWLGYDAALDRQVAIKLLKPQLQIVTDQAAGFLQEARTAARLNHPNVITVFQVGQHAGRFFIAMEYLPRGSLQDELSRNGRLDFRQATLIIRDAAGGLGAAHAAGIIHRDIKPGNLLRGENGLTKVADFGLARPEASFEPVLHPAKILGTPSFIAPEQVQGQPVDARTDLYSLTCTYYALLTGHPPFVRQGEALTPEVLLQRHVQAPFPDAREEVPELPPSISAILERGSRKDPTERYQNALELWQALDAVASDFEESPADSRGRPERVKPTEPPAKSGLVAVAEFLSRNRKRSLVLLAAAALGVFALAVLPRWARQPILAPLAHLGLGREGLKEATWVEPSLERLTPPADKLAGAKTAREEKLQGLRTMRWDSIAGLFYAGQERFISMAGDRDYSLPDRFVLSGTLAAVRVWDGKTWVCLVARAAYGPNGPSSPNWPPMLGVLVVFNNPAVAGAMLDYKAGDYVLAAVAKTDWEHSENFLPDNLPPSGSFGPSGSATPAALQNLAYFRHCTDGNAYLCFTGEGIQQMAEPLSWIDAEGHRMLQAANAAQMAASPGMMYRDLPKWLGRQGIVEATFVRSVNGPEGLVVLAAVTNSIEGYIPLQLELGKQARPEEFLDYAEGDQVLAEILLRNGSVPSEYLRDNATQERSYRFGTTNFQLVGISSSAQNLLMQRNASSGMNPYGFSATAPGRFLGGGTRPLARPPSGGNPAQYERGRSTSRRGWTNVFPNPLAAWIGVDALCSRIQKVDHPETLVSANGSRRNAAPPPEVTPLIAAANPAAHLGRKIHWKGRLTNILAGDGETHLLVATDGAPFGVASFEAYTRQKEFMDALADYLSDHDPGPKGDMVTIQGRIGPQEGCAYRLSSRDVLVELAEIEREGNPASRVVAGKTRSAGTIETNRAPSGLNALMRNIPAPGTEVTFPALFSFASSEGCVTVRAQPDPNQVNPRRIAQPVSVFFTNVAKADWSDYAAIRGPVEIAAIVRKPASPSKIPALELVGKHIMRPGNPASLITEQGRVSPLRDFSQEKRRWEQLRFQSRLAGPERVQMSALFRKFDNESPPTVHFDKLFFGYESLEVACSSLPPDAESFLRALQGGEEVSLEVELTRGSGYKPDVHLVWMARSAEPDNKIRFASPEK